MDKQEMTVTRLPWRYEVNYGLDGEAIYANIYDGGYLYGSEQLISNIKTPYAKHMVRCINENEALHARIKELEDWITFETQSPSQKMCDVLSKVFNKIKQGVIWKN